MTTQRRVIYLMGLAMTAIDCGGVHDVDIDQPMGTDRTPAPCGAATAGPSG